MHNTVASGKTFRTYSLLFCFILYYAKHMIHSGERTRTPKYDHHQPAMEALPWA
jgi:hypothetical protein